MSELFLSCVGYIVLGCLALVCLMVAIGFSYIVIREIIDDIRWG